MLCQLNSHALAQLQFSSSLPLQLLAAQIILLGSRCWHQGRLHSTSLIHHRQLRMTQAAMLAKVAPRGCDRDRRKRPHYIFTGNSVSRCSIPIVFAVTSATITKQIGCCACRTAHISISKQDYDSTLSNQFLDLAGNR